MSKMQMSLRHWLVIRRAIKFAIETNFSCVIIESDSLSVVKAMHLLTVMKSCEFRGRQSLKRNLSVVILNDDV